MSYEGYTQLLCSKGHLWHADCSADTEKEVCPTCKSPIVWSNSVDQTNCDEHGYIELEIDKPSVICKCNKCGIEHTVEPPTYKIPPPDAREKALDEWVKRQEDANEKMD
jgi:hypothetical protein